MRRGRPTRRCSSPTCARFVAERRLDVRWSDEIPGVDRCYVDDPFGNRIELIDVRESAR